MFNLNYHKISIKSYVVDVYKNRLILWRTIENYLFYHFDSDPRFPPFLLYVRCKSGVTFVRRCFRGVTGNINLKG